MNFKEAEKILWENKYIPRRLVRVTLDGDEVTGLAVSCSSLALDDHLRKIQQLLPSFKVNFNPNTLTIYIE